MHVTIVTVTYGRRWHLLEQSLRAALENGADLAIVVDNGAEEKIAPKAAFTFPGRVHTQRLEENQGSSGGYCAGLQSAMNAGAEYLLLLDDDNCVEPDTIAILKRAWEDLSATTPADRLCVVAFRPDHMSEIIEGHPCSQGISELADAFFGFHIKDLPRKLWKRMPGRRRSQVVEVPGYADRLYFQATAPFGGMFFHRSVLERHGLPKASLVLYHDDLEFTYRISSTGGKVVVVPRARITDLERSWGNSPEKKNSLERIVDLGSDREVYYTARNLAWFESHRRETSWFRIINRAVWLCAVWGLARMRKRKGRFFLILKAIRDGENNALGINPAFPLVK